METNDKILDEDLIFLDLETDPENLSVIEWALIDAHGVPLFCSPVRPPKKPNNRFARKGLCDNKLKNAPSWEIIRPLIEKIVMNKRVVAWNMGCDASFFEGELALAKGCICGMERFSPMYSLREFTTRYSDPKSSDGKYKFISLMDACHDIRLEPPIGYRWHRAFTDPRC